MEFLRKKVWCTDLEFLTNIFYEICWEVCGLLFYRKQFNFEFEFETLALISIQILIREINFGLSNLNLFEKRAFSCRYTKPKLRINSFANYKFELIWILNFESKDPHPTIKILPTSGPKWPLTNSKHTPYCKPTSGTLRGASWHSGSLPGYKSQAKALYLLALSNLDYSGPIPPVALWSPTSHYTQNFQPDQSLGRKRVLQILSFDPTCACVP